MYKVCLQRNQCGYSTYVEEEPDYTDIAIIVCPVCYSNCVFYTDEYFLNKYHNAFSVYGAFNASPGMDNADDTDSKG